MTHIRHDMHPPHVRHPHPRHPRHLRHVSHLVTAVALAAAVTVVVAQKPPAPAASPRFQVDPTWPKELPNNWILGSVTGVFLDAKDHVWVTHLPETLTEEETSAVQKPPIATCCAPAPTVIELDPQGNVVQGWGDASQDPSTFPRNPHGIFVDDNGFVWVGTHMHHRVMKFTREGKLVMTIGTYDKTAGSNDTTLLGGPAGIWVDPKTNEAFIADGYRNRRVIVFEGATGKYLRHWGAYGEVPDDTQKPVNNPEGPPNKQFSTVHGITGTRDGFIYVADRRGNRIQVFDQKGKFIKEKIIAPRTLASGSAFVLVPSQDRAEQWLYMADGTNHKIWVLRRTDLEVVGEFGHGGRQLGQMLRPHGMSVDSKGNLYVGEASTGRRVQRFLLQVK
jgi:DNA-binding beta-propeller fold protein YncE